MEDKTFSQLLRKEGVWCWALRNQDVIMNSGRSFPEWGTFILGRLAWRDPTGVERDWFPNQRNRMVILRLSISFPHLTEALHSYILFKRSSISYTSFLNVHNLKMHTVWQIKPLWSF